ncbi:MAG: TRAP-type C4-dicarboxylate transport system permease small subunit, partial [Paracoccaceae bacterium]
MAIKGGIMGFVRRLRTALDFLYLASGVMAALCLIAILLLIVVQMVARWTGEVFPGAPDYAGYAMASASFLAFANALNRGAHIRVSILINAVGPRARRW